MIQKVAIVAAGGAIGAVLRYGLSAWLQRLAPHFPLGTLVVNVLGCLAIGALVALTERDGLPAGARLFLGVGCLGAFTTFSAFGAETLALLRRGDTALALLSVAGNLLLGLAAVAAGRALVRAL